MSEGILTRNKIKGTCLLSEVEPRYVIDALEDENWIEVMNEEIQQIEKNKT